MKYGTPIDGTISHLLPEGPGAFEKDGRTFAVRFSVPGDSVTGTIRRRDKKIHLLEATVTSPSPDRVVPHCSFAGTCGGCAWQQINYPAQLKWKQKMVQQALGQYTEIAGDAEGGTLPRASMSTVGSEGGRTRDTLEIVPSPEQFYYRNRMDYVFGSDGTLGLKEPEKWWSVVNLTDCYLLSETAPRILAEVRAWATKNELTYWNQKTETGLLRYVMIREGKNTNERLVNIVTSGDATTPEDVWNDLVARLDHFATHIVHGRQPLQTDLSLASEFRVLKGASLTFTERLLDKTFAIHPNSFFQTNTRGTEQLLSYLQELIPSGRHLLDLYCGVGTIGLTLAARFQTVHGIEADAEAVALAEKNAQTNNVLNATFESAKVEDVVTRPGAALISALQKSDVCVIDPPRAGLHPRVTTTLAEHGPATLIYVSCNYRALARELTVLLQHYRIHSIRLFDLFPHTPHVETVVLLERI